MATVLLFRCQVAEGDLVDASRALERAGLRVEDVTSRPEPLITAARAVTRRGAVLGTWADAVEHAHVELRSAGVSACVELAGVRRSAHQQGPGAAAATG